MAVTFVGIVDDGSGTTLAPYEQSQELPRGNSGTATITVKRVNGLNANITGGSLIWSVRDSDYNLLFARQADLLTSSTASFPYTTEDTINAVNPSGDAGREGIFYTDVVFIDGAGTYGDVGGRFQLVPSSPFLISATETAYPAVVSVPTSQAPLAQ